ncbi:type II restriction endonuclease [Pseudoalteromonas rubra]|nr:type II restriction endonuclease [Pseudoalteromonas rubra]
MFEQLSDVFTSAAFKYLTAVDANRQTSNQHEIGGLKQAGIGEHIGMPDNGIKVKLPATLVYLSDDPESPLVVEDHVTWYDTRYNQSGRSAEWRMYYASNDVSERFSPEDFFLIALTKDREVLMIFCPPDSEYEAQIRALFGVQNMVSKEKLSKVEVKEGKVVLPIRLMFARYGIEIGQDGTDVLEQILDKFGPHFPKTKHFSDFTRTLAREICPVTDPDSAIIEWMETEESAFRQLEKHIVKEKLREGFGEDGDDLDEFLRFSLSVQNRRKSRSGHAFENHIETILSANGLPFERGANTEGRQKPDFLFPSDQAYKSSDYPCDKLRMLGAKTTCKDRWRQVLVEASRIKRKHLITMEPAISEAQTTQMDSMNLQLVVPDALHSTYQPTQANWLLSFHDFISDVKLATV